MPRLQACGVQFEMLVRWFVPRGDHPNDAMHASIEHQARLQLVEDPRARDLPYEFAEDQSLSKYVCFAFARFGQLFI